MSRRNSRAAKARRREAKSARKDRSQWDVSNRVNVSVRETRGVATDSAGIQLEQTDYHPLAIEGANAFREHQLTGRPEALDFAVRAFQEAVAVTRPGHPRRGGYLSDLGGAMVTRFGRTGNEADLEAAIAAGRQAVDATPPGHPERGMYLSNLGNSLRVRFERASAVADLDAAIIAGRQAVDATPPGHPNRAVILHNLGLSLEARFERTSNDADLDAVIEILQQAVDVTPPDYPARAALLADLGNHLGIRFTRTRSIADVDAAIEILRSALDVTQRGHPDFTGFLSELAGLLLTRFRQTGDKTGLDAAVESLQQAVDATPPRHSDLAGYLSNLGICLRARFELTGNEADLDAAVDAGQHAVEATQHGHPDRAMYASNLGAALQTRFRRRGDAADLDAAIDNAREAVDATPRGQPNRTAYQSNLAASLLARFDQAGDEADLDAAIEFLRQAVDATPPRDLDFAGRMSNLGDSLRIRFERTGDEADLDAAIDVGRRAVAVALPGQPNQAMYLSNLANARLARFRRVGDDADLDAAVDAGREAVDAVPPGHPNRAMYLSNLVYSLQTRFQQTGDVTDLDAAVDAGREAVDATPPGHPGLAKYRVNLANALSLRFMHVGETCDLNAAIKAVQHAVEVTQPGQPSRAVMSSNLGICLHARFEQTGDVADLDAAVVAARQAVDTSPAGHPGVAAYLVNLGTFLMARFERTGVSADLDAALDSWRQASLVPTGTPSIRLSAARFLGANSAEVGRLREAANAYETAVGLLPELAWHGLDRETREKQLAQWSGLAADAAACAVLDARPKLAVELLEQGRSILWTQALNLRTDLSRLTEKAPQMAERLDNIRELLNIFPPDFEPQLSGAARGIASAPDLTVWGQDSIDRRRRLAREWDDVLSRVRALEGFEHFLTTIPYAELASATGGGPVVAVNGSRYGCHALIVACGADYPQVVELPGLSLESAVGQASKMLAALLGAIDHRASFPGREKSRHAILDVLGWLWDVLAEPVLAALGHTGPPQAGERWPRVWWCPTGPLTVLPIHAAGYYPRHRTTTAGIQTVLDRVISSYTPTLTALTRAYRPSQPAQIRQMAVGMPTTPGLPPLPAVRAELEVLARHFPPTAGNHQLVESQATRADVAAAIAGHSWVHLACHAGQAHADPARSGFALWDGILSITDLAAQPTQHRDLAFLSACQTATGSVRHLDEAIHLAAAMQFLGYRHVIATMWTIADSPAPHIADSVYTTLTTGGIAGPDRAAEALHRAVHSLRHIDPTDPLLWAPYIHLGP
jgi:tetratricopeptide (TPR) repeat protein